MRLIEEILADINKAKAKVTSVELEIGHTTGVSSQINGLIQAQNLLTYCHSRLSDIDHESLRPKGEWKIEKRHSVSSNPYMDDVYFAKATCPICDFIVDSSSWRFGYPKLNTTNFCSNCGCDMRGTKDDMP